MRKDEYLNQIAQGLKQYDKTYVDEIVRDYEEHFREAQQQGRSEEEICEALGDSENIIKAMKEMLDGGQEYEIARPWAEADKADCQSDRKHWKETKDEDTWRWQGGITKIRFYAGNADVRLCPSMDGQFHIYTEDEEELEYLEYRYEGDTYFGRVRNRENPYFPGLERLFGWLNSPVDTVILEIPANLEEVSIESLSGDVRAEGTGMRSLSITSMSGDVSVRDIACQSIFLSSKSGDLSLKKTRTESLIIETISGDVQYKNVIANIFTFNAVSGDMGGRKIESRNVYLKTVSGDIRLDLQCSGEPFYVCAKTVSGDVKLKGGFRVKESEFHSENIKEAIRVSASTISGDLAVYAAK